MAFVLARFGQRPQRLDPNALGTPTGLSLRIPIEISVRITVGGAGAITGRRFRLGLGPGGLPRPTVRTS